MQDLVDAKAKWVFSCIEEAHDAQHDRQTRDDVNPVEDVTEEHQPVGSDREANHHLCRADHVEEQVGDDRQHSVQQRLLLGLKQREHNVRHNEGRHQPRKPKGSLAGLGGLEELPDVLGHLATPDVCADNLGADHAPDSGARRRGCGVPAILRRWRLQSLVLRYHLISLAPAAAVVVLRVGVRGLMGRLFRRAAALQRKPRGRARRGRCLSRLGCHP
mmetsp:Transcript_90105/g.263448  ORF Transcript_90105/g.263448 Transcript_90105/m.263448 type:complete len:217 (-) Transcript_90105:611-1261(-)